MSGQTTNPNDFKVVTFTNKEDFVFTPELGSMYDSRPIFGKSGAPIQPGESVVLPYHVGNLVAKNLAKQAMVRNVPADDKNVPTGVSIWDEPALQSRQASYIENMFSEEKPTMMSETDLLMAKVEEYKALVEQVLPQSERDKLSGAKTEESTDETPKAESPAVYQDKADVIAELTKRGIKHDARKSKAELEKQLV